LQVECPGEEKGLAAAEGKQSGVAHYLGIERNVTAASAAVFLLGLGEELWKKFLPKYMESLGAGPGAIGLFGTAEDCFDALYQYPGGWLADRLGRRRAFFIFIALAAVGYVTYLVSPSWPPLFIGLGFAMAWQSMASPAIFAVIGDALPKERRAMGFSLQSILKRVPVIVSPVLGGILIARMGIQKGMRTGLAITLALAAATILILMAINIPLAPRNAVGIRGVWQSFHTSLKRLLVSDIIIRTCEGMADVFIVLYVTDITGITIVQYGTLVAIQMATSILVYVPSASLADRIGRRPFVITTFLCFALFPIAVVLAESFGALVLAFIIGGLREIGEPSRKAMIVDFADQRYRARSVGLYYLVRSLSVTPAAAIGGLLWKVVPSMPFVTAGLIGLGGTIVFAATVRE
jgi:MFS family permease